MDVIIVVHTEYGYVSNNKVIYDKNYYNGVKVSVPNLINIANKYGAKITFAVMPEVIEHFPKKIEHEIGLHIHPGWKVQELKDIKYEVGDRYIRKKCNINENSVVLKDYCYKNQLDMIKAGKDALVDSFGIVPKTFVAGKWSINNDTVKALINTGFTHECSAHYDKIKSHYDWTKLNRLDLPYNPHNEDYQKKGDLPLIIVPVSQIFPKGNVNPEISYLVGLSWLKASFLEYYKQDMPVFHICLHSPCMLDPNCISVMDNFLKFIGAHKNVNFKFASQIKVSNEINPKTNILPYMTAFNVSIAKTIINKLIMRSE